MHSSAVAPHIPTECISMKLWVSNTRTSGLLFIMNGGTSSASTSAIFLTSRSTPAPISRASLSVHARMPRLVFKLHEFGLTSMLASWNTPESSTFLNGAASNAEVRMSGNNIAEISDGRIQIANPSTGNQIGHRIAKPDGRTLEIRRLSTNLSFS